jgi:hypothetical protein
MVFFKKNILIPTVAEKNIQILVEEKKNKSDSEFLSYNLMLNSGRQQRQPNHNTTTYCVY